MSDRFIPYSDETQAKDLRERSLVVVRRPYDSLLKEDLQAPQPYQALAARRGKEIKKERRTEIRLWEMDGRTIYFKHYLYFGMSQLKTLLSRTPKAKREYLTLGYLRHLGIPAVEAVGWGAQWDRLGGVHRCFVLTIKEEGTLDFRAWLKKTEPEPGFREKTAAILRKLAEFFRRMHGQGFFLLRPNTRNVLIRRPEDPDPDVLFLDQPYARFLSGPGARWGQLQDLSTLLGGTLRHTDEGILDDFLKVYLPDPLGASPETLLRRLKLFLQARDSEGQAAKLMLRLRALAPAFLDKS